MIESLRPLQVIVQFGASVPAHVQGPALLAFEREMRKLAPGLMIEVFREAKGDDSKPRMAMTPEQRSKL
jgi:hypothetical protein